MRTRTIVKPATIILILVFFMLHLGLFLCCALAVEKRPSKSKVKQLSGKKGVCTVPVVERESFLELVKQYIGIPYRWGGASEKGMDCSGFVKHIYSKTFSLDLPHSSSQQSALPIMKKVPRDDLRIGDLVFFSPKKKRINHVGIYLGDGEFIHAGRESGVTISSLDSNYWKMRMVCAKRPDGLWHPESAGYAHLFASVETAMKDNEHLSKESDRKSMGFSTLEGGLRPSSWWDLSPAGDLQQGLTHSFELQLSHSFGESSWKMSVLQENFGRHSLADDDHLPTPLPASLVSNRQYSLDGYRQGVKMTSDVYPLDWLRITSSFSYVGFEQGAQKARSWGPDLGFAVQIRPSLARWSFAADFRYWDESDQQLGSFINDLDQWKNRNLSLMLGYDLSNDVRFRIVGQHSPGSSLSYRENSSKEQQKNNGLFFGFDWAF